MQRTNFVVWIVFVAFSLVSRANCVEDVDRKSILDDCCCEVDNVLTANHQDLNPLLNQIVSKRFFNYFKLDLFSKCPFWATEFLCGVGGCAICECNEDEIPQIWKQEKTDLVNVTVPQNFVSWKDSDEHMWIVQGKEEDMSYVNIAMYPEANTGYLDGRHVWESIYNENCFKGSVDEMCTEERVFFRLISGLHTSINIHVARYWERESPQREWKTNAALYNAKIRPFPERKKNLYFTFLFLLRAVNKLAPLLESYHYNTGSSAEASEVHVLMKQLLATKLLCSPNFDESILFSDPEKESLRNQLKSHFRNISLIMNCVTCEKCKVYAKLQVLGLGTALKVLLEPNAEIVMKTLQRNEIIALINTLRQLSNSIEAIEFFENPEVQVKAFTVTEVQEFSWTGIITVIAFIVIAFKVTKGFGSSTSLDKIKKS